MQSIELKVVFTDLPELAAFIGSMPNVQLALSQPAAELRVAHEPVHQPAQIAAPVHHVHQNPAPVQHVAPAVHHNTAPAQHAAPAPAAPAISIPEIKKLMVSRLQGLNGHAKLSPEVLRGLFARHQVQSVDFLQPHQLDGFHMELQNL
jgi:hypothetical protein